MDRLIEEYLTFLLLEKGLSKNSVNSYRNDLEKFKSFLKKHHKKIEEIELNDLNNFLIELESRGYNPSTRSRIVSAVRGFFLYLTTEKGLETNPAELLELPKKEKKLPEVLTEQEVEALLSLPDTTEPKGIRNKALLEILYATGMRVSEVSYLRLRNVDLDQRFIKVLGKGSKERFVPFGELARKWLLEYLTKVRPLIDKRKSDYVFLNMRDGKPLSRVSIWKIIKSYGILAGIPSEKLYPHILRHTFATHLLRNGCDLRTLQLMLGHASIAITQIYTHLDIGYLSKVHKKYHPRG